MAESEHDAMNWMLSHKKRAVITRFYHLQKLNLNYTTTKPIVPQSKVWGKPVNDAMTKNILGLR